MIAFSHGDTIWRLSYIHNVAVQGNLSLLPGCNSYLCSSIWRKKVLEPVSWSTEFRLAPTSYTIHHLFMIVSNLFILILFSLRTVAWFAFVHLTPTNICSCLLLFPKQDPLEENLTINKMRKTKKNEKMFVFNKKQCY